MSEEQNPRNQAIEEFIKANFGNAPVQEMVMLVRKDQRDPFIQTLKGSGLAVVAMLSKMAEHNISKLTSMGQNVEDFWQMHILVSVEQHPILVKVLEHAGVTGLVSEKAKAIADFYTKTGTGETLQ